MDFLFDTPLALVPYFDPVVTIYVNSSFSLYHYITFNFISFHLISLHFIFFTLCDSTSDDSVLLLTIYFYPEIDSFISY